MNSLDFLTLREVIEECFRLAALPVLLIMLLAGVVVAIMSAWGYNIDQELRYVLTLPFGFSAIRGNVVIYNVRVAHGVRTFGGRWWLRLTGLAILWTVGFAAISMIAEFLAIHFGVISGPFTPISEIAVVLMCWFGFALLLSLIPAKEHVAM